MTRLSIGLGLVALCAATVLLVRVPADADADDHQKQVREREVRLDRVPAKVKATILKAAGKNKVTEVEETTVTLYEAEWTKGGNEIEVLVTRRGKLLEKEVERDDDDDDEGKAKKKRPAQKKQKKQEARDDDDDDEEDEHEKEVSLDEIPEAARAAILKLAGDSRIEEVEEVRTKLYEAEWMQGRREVEILVSAGGKLLGREVEKADDDDEDDDDDDDDDDDEEDDDHEHGHHHDKDGHDHDDDD